MAPYRRRKAVRRTCSKRNQGLDLLATRSIAVRIKVDLGSRPTNVQRHIRLNRRTNTKITGARRLVKAEVLRTPGICNVFRRQRLQGIENRVVLVTHPILLVLRKTVNLKGTVGIRLRLISPVLARTVMRDLDLIAERLIEEIRLIGRSRRIGEGDIRKLATTVYVRPNVIVNVKRNLYVVRRLCSIIITTLNVEGVSTTGRQLVDAVIVFRARNRRDNLNAAIRNTIRIRVRRKRTVKVMILVIAPVRT